MNDIAFVNVDINSLINDFGKRLSRSKTTTLMVVLGAGYLLLKQAAKIQSLTKENEELKKIKEE